MKTADEFDRLLSALDSIQNDFRLKIVSRQLKELAGIDEKHGIGDRLSKEALGIDSQRGTF
jgi:hypothetical protein